MRGCSIVSVARPPRSRKVRRVLMNIMGKAWRALLAFIAVGMMASVPATAQQQQKPNILFIMGDDIGWMQPSIYHRGLMVGETPNIDKIRKEGARFTGY